MRLPRAAVARGTVAELQSINPISPAEAANVQLAKYGAIATGAKAIGDVFHDVAETRRRTQVAKDDITYQTNENNLTAAYKNLQNDPNLKKPVQDDGSSTAEYYQRESDALLKTYQQGVDDLGSEQARSIATQRMRDREVLLRADMAGDLGVIEAREAEGKFIEGINSSISVGDTEGAKKILSTAFENGLVSAKGRQTWLVNIQKTDNQAQAQSLVDEVNEAYAESQDAGDKALSDLIKNDKLDQQVRDQAIDGAEEKKTEWAKARDENTKQAEVQAVVNFGDDSLLAAQGGLSYEQADARYKSERYGTGTGAATRRNQLFTRITASIGKKETEINIRQSYENGQFMSDDQKHRDALSEYEDEVTAGMDPQERMSTIGDISRTLGTTSTQTSNKLNMSSKSETALASNLPMFVELTRDDQLQPNLNLKSKSNAMLEDGRTLMEAGLNAPEAANIAFANARPSELEKAERDTTWKDEIISTAESDYGALLKTDTYDEPGFFRSVDDPPALMQVEYGAVYKEVYMQTGNAEAAKRVADTAISKSWVMTNLNSANPKDYTIEKGGIPGDSSKIRNGMIREFSGESFRIKKDDGTYKTSSIDADKIRFIFREKDEEGARVYSIEHDGVPLTSVTEDGIQVATYVLDEQRISTYRQNMAPLEAAEKRIRDIDNETTRLDGLVEDSPWWMALPGQVKGRQQRTGALQKEKKRLEKELPELRPKF